METMSRDEYERRWKARPTLPAIPRKDRVVKKEPEAKPMDADEQAQVVEWCLNRLDEVEGDRAAVESVARYARRNLTGARLEVVEETVASYLSERNRRGKAKRA